MKYIITVEVSELFRKAVENLINKFLKSPYFKSSVVKEEK